MITDKTSQAFSFVSKAQNKGGVYFIGNKPCVACSTFYGNVGDELRITLSSGKIFHAIVCDTKKEHELINHAHSDGSVLEFIVEEKDLPVDIIRDGSLNRLV